MLILVLVLLSWHLLAQSMSPASAVVILEPIFDPSECVKVGSAISFSCTVEDSKGYSATIWSGGVSSIQVFNCPSPNSITRDRLFLSHSASQPVAFCGDRAFARLNSVTNKTVYTSILYLYNTTLNMNGGYVRCTDLNSQTYEQIQLSIEGDIINIMSILYKLVYVHSFAIHVLHVVIHSHIYTHTLASISAFHHKIYSPTQFGNWAN